jgi:hypothetical protein
MDLENRFVLFDTSHIGEQVELDEISFDGLLISERRGFIRFVGEGFRE